MTPSRSPFAKPPNINLCQKTGFFGWLYLVFVILRKLPVSLLHSYLTSCKILHFSRLFLFFLAGFFLFIHMSKTTTCYALLSLLFFLLRISKRNFLINFGFLFAPKLRYFLFVISTIFAPIAPVFPCLCIPHIQELVTLQKII